MSKKVSDVPFEKNPNGTIKLTKDNQILMRDLLNSTGPGFCLAKWTQVTMHLGVGLTHSCHHPTAHKIDLEELRDNPSALHNTGIKKAARKEMLSGDRPSECEFCWRIEDKSGEISDRVLKSYESFSVTDHDSITEMAGDEDVYPRYVEISFSNVCNFKCSYCGPTYSSKWVEEINHHGAYNLPGIMYNTYQDIQIPSNTHNPYVEAFWKWFPDALPHMHTFRITGGEPLMNKNAMDVLDYIIENPNPELNFAINSNACVPDKLWNEFIEKAKIITQNKCVRTFTLFVSAESTGKQAEYSRFGMSWPTLVSNVEKFLIETKRTRVTFMAAYNIFSVSTIKDFLQYVLSLKRKFNADGNYRWVEECGIDVSDGLQCDLGDYAFNDVTPVKDRNTTLSGAEARIGVDIPYVRFPEFLDHRIITMSMIQDYVIPAVDFMYHNLDNEWHGSFGFAQWEALKLKRILIDGLIACKDSRNDDETTTDGVIARQRVQFYEFVNEYDSRRHTNFLQSFPEYGEFLKICEIEYNKHNDT